HGVRFPTEHQVSSPEAAVSAAQELGHPVALKLGGAAIAHKTERGLVRLGLADDSGVATAAADLLAAARPEDGEVHLLVAKMLSGNRELIAGLHHDEQFGMTVMLGIGGVLTEALADVAFRLVPISRADAHEMIHDLATQGLLGEVRGEPPVDREALADVLLALSAASVADPSIVAADLNPLIVVDGTPVPVDALVERAA
ncbi:MAG: acetate--CoA ligase family protein, partial [Acidimicrobiales bacterium]|nr:acetate--CoA ligase family protein [Acidimicrobiales bacterium]